MASFDNLAWGLNLKHSTYETSVQPQNQKVVTVLK